MEVKEIKFFNQFTKHLQKSALLVFIFTLVVLLFVTFSPAASNNADANKQITITANQVIDDDLYLSGETLTIDGTIKGDAVLSGQTITINGAVNGDLIAAGQTITINGVVKDDVRIAGQVLSIGDKAQIADDLIAAGASLESKVGSKVGGDVSFFGAQAILAGTVNKNVLGAMNSLELRGSVGQNMRVTAVGDPNPLKLPFIPKPQATIPEIPEGLTILDTAKIAGKLTYQSTKDAQINPKAQVIGGVVRKKLAYKGRHEGLNASTQPQTSTGIILQQLQRLAALLLIGWLLLRFVPNWTQTLTTTVRARPLSSLGWGLVTVISIVLLLILAPILTVLFSGLLAFVLPNLVLPIFSIGILFTICISVGFAIFATCVPQIIISFVSGRWLMEHLRPNQVTGKTTSLVVGLLIFVAISLIPVLGGIFELVIILMGLGAIWLWGRGGKWNIKHRQLMSA
jgi:cytoskeletal protein CcmA (bactofilin family)